MKPHAVYRMFGASGDLLYVGMSANPTRRLSEHNSKSARRSEVCRVEIEWFGSVIEARKAEAEAIKTLRPRDNHPTRKQFEAAQRWQHGTGAINCSMPMPEDILKMEDKLASIGVSVSDLCEAAGIAQTTWWRWKEERFSPRLKVWLDVSAAYHRLTAGTASVAAAPVGAPHGVTDLDETVIR